MNFDDNHHSLIDSVQINRTLNLLKTAFLVEWTSTILSSPPHESLLSPIPFDFRHISLRKPLTYIHYFIRYVSISIV